MVNLTIKYELFMMIFGCGIRALVAVILLVLAAEVRGASSITRHGVTWTFDKNYQSGQYANGDPWVVGPITITNITPKPAVGRNGTVVNPALGRTQGYDDRISSSNVYNHSMNVGASLPLNVAVDSSVVSSISKATNVTFNQLEILTVLTVVKQAPAAGSFRPPYAGHGSRNSKWNKSNLDYSKLNNLPRSGLSSVPSISNVAASFEKLWYEQDTTWTGRYLHLDHMAINGYGKDMAIKTGNAALLLNLDFTQAEKESLLVGFVQYGLDIHGIINSGRSWGADGGHNPGRLAPLVVAAMVLNDSTMKGQITGAANKFQEFQQTFNVSATDVALARYTADGRPRRAYTNADIGKPEWGESHFSAPQRDGNNWDAYYRDIGGGVLQAPAAAAIAMGAKALINAPAFFDYAKRHIYYREGFFTNPKYFNGWDDGHAYGQGNTSKSAPFSSNETPGFHRSFYLAYHDKDVTSPSVVGAPVISPAGGKYLSEIDVSLSSLTSGAVIHFTTNGSAPTTASPVYTAPIKTSSSSTVRAMAAKTGMVSSSTTSGEFDFGPHAGGSGWTNLTIPTQTGKFTLTIAVTPGVNPMDGVIGLSNGNASSYGQLACIVRFNTSGTIDARNGDSYAASNMLSYSAGTQYTVSFVVDMGAKKYTATVASQGGSAVVIAENYSFRTEQNGVEQLTRLAFIDSVASGSDTLLIGTSKNLPRRPTGLRVVSP